MTTYPTIERLADPANTTVGYQAPELIAEAVRCWHALEKAERERDEAIQRADQSDAVSKVDRLAFFSANAKLADADKALEIGTEIIDDAQNRFVAAEAKLRNAEAKLATQSQDVAIPRELVAEIIEEFLESAEANRSSNTSIDGTWSDDPIDQHAKACYEWLLETVESLRTALSSVEAATYE